MQTKAAPKSPAPPRALAAELVPLLAAREADHDRAGCLAFANLDTLLEAGLFRINVPRQFEGLDANLLETLETLRVLAHGSPSTALMLAMHTSILANYRLDPQLVPETERPFFATQRDWAFGEVARGKIFAVANSEVGAAGDVHLSKALVRNDGTLEGFKTFCSMGLRADYYMAAARDELGTVDYYLVPRTGAVTVGSPWDAVGMRSSESVSLRFQNAPVIGRLGYRGMLDGANNRHWSTLSFTAIYIGIAESLLEEVARGAAAILQKVTAVDLELSLQASRAFLRHCAEQEPSRPARDYGQLVRDCKLFVTRSLTREGSALFASQTGSAYRFSSGLSRKFRDLLSGPMLRPPVGLSFDTVWEELAGKAEG